VIDKVRVALHEASSERVQLATQLIHHF
jgi:hypothetical protein